MKIMKWLTRHLGLSVRMAREQESLSLGQADASLLAERQLERQPDLLSSSKLSSADAGEARHERQRLADSMSTDGPHFVGLLLPSSKASSLELEAAETEVEGSGPLYELEKNEDLREKIAAVVEQNELGSPSKDVDGLLNFEVAEEPEDFFRRTMNETATGNSTFRPRKLSGRPSILAPMSVQNTVLTMISLRSGNEAGNLPNVP